MARILSRDRDKDPFNDNEVSICFSSEDKTLFYSFQLSNSFTKLLLDYLYINVEVLQC